MLHVAQSFMLVSLSVGLAQPGKPDDAFGSQSAYFASVPGDLFFTPIGAPQEFYMYKNPSNRSVVDWTDSLLRQIPLYERWAMESFGLTGSRSTVSMSAVAVFHEQEVIRSPILYHTNDILRRRRVPQGTLAETKPAATRTAESGTEKSKKRKVD